jgi:hypothetical protein
MLNVNYKTWGLHLSQKKEIEVKQIHLFDLTKSAAIKFMDASRKDVTSNIASYHFKEVIELLKKHGVAIDFDIDTGILTIGDE